MMYAVHPVLSAVYLPAWRAGATSLSGCAFRLLLAIVMCAFAGCRVEPAKVVPTLHERQVATLRSLGFNETPDGWLMSIAEPISFDINKAELRPELSPSLKRVAQELLAADIRALRIEGHTDNTGTREYNEQLSLRRSKAVAEVFIRDGFAQGNILCRGFAWDFPIASNAAREGRAENRRVNIIVPASSMATGP
jgi:outer membrane protein OmpA-like peptidoglycan-associated protein